MITAFPEGFLSEDLLREYVDLLVRVIEAIGVVVVFAGAVVAVVRLLRAVASRSTEQRFTRIRLGLGRYLALGLEFQLASDILATAVAPTFEEIGKLAAVAAVRTALNYFLGKELAIERSQVEQDRS